MPASTGRDQAGTRVREPATSTTQIRQTLTGARFSRKQSVGMSMPWARQASRMVEPAGTDTTASSMVSSTCGAGSATGGRGTLGERGAGVNQIGSGSAVTSHLLDEGRDEPAGDGGLDRGRRRLAEAADRGVAHGLAELAQQGKLLGLRPERPVGRDPPEQLL